MKHLKLVSGLATVMLMSLTAGVQAADIEAGKKMAITCVGCHGENGRASNPLWPNLAGQNTEYLVAQLKAFKDGSRKNELMSPMAQSLSEDDAKNVAAYFNSLSK